jgi:hypothetical protein
MTRAFNIALSHIEARSLALPSFERLRNAFAHATKVEAAAATIYSDNQAIRGSSRGWMI